MHPPQLEGCFAKIARAKDHVHALAAAERAYFNGVPFEIRPTFDAKTGLYTFVGHVNEQLPVEIGVILGDFVHNLRSALDHLVWELVTASRAIR